MMARLRDWVRWQVHRRGALVPASIQDAQYNVLLPLHELLPPAPPPKGLLARIEQSIDGLDSEQAVIDEQPPPRHSRYQLLAAGLAGALIGMAAATVLALAT